MGKANAARRLASAAAYGGGGLSVLGAALYGVLTTEAKVARKTIGQPDKVPPPDATGWYGRGRPGPGLKIAILGDSAAAGYGVSRVEETPGALIAVGLASAADRRVFVRPFAKVGARTSDLAGQIERALPTTPDLAVILIGANDVTHKVLPSQSVRQLAEGVRELRAAGVEVVVGTCPDLGTVQPIAPPLKQVARAWSRRLAAAQAIVTVEEGGRAVSLGSILGPDFAAAPALLFGPDRFHPSADGYRALASVLLPTVVAALGFGTAEERPVSARGERVLPVSRAAVQAAREPGTELSGTEVGGSARGFLGRWVALRHRVRREQPVAEQPEAEGADLNEAPAG